LLPARQKKSAQIEPQIIGTTPQQKTENADCKQQSQEHRARFRVYALLDASGKNSGGDAKVASIRTDLTSNALNK